MGFTACLFLFAFRENDLLGGKAERLVVKNLGLKSLFLHRKL